MIRYLSAGLMLIVAILFSGCTHHQPPGPCVDLTCETWQSQVSCQPRVWAAGADDWFLGREVDPSELTKQSSIPGMSTMMVRVSNELTNINVNGNFRVQLFGTTDDNSVFLQGSNESLRNIHVKVRGNTLCLIQDKNVPPNVMRCVVVRIGIRNLMYLNQMGPGIVEGRLIRSNCLTVQSSGCGNIYLGGIMNLRRVVNTGAGCITIFGAHTPQVDITTTDAGSVNISGNVGARYVTHHGCGCINIVGANSRFMCIKTDGKGKISIRGRSAVSAIDAGHQSQVYLYYVDGNSLNVKLADNAHVGLAGCTCHLSVDARDSARFDGRNLYTKDAYVRAQDASHVNVTGSEKVFAASIQNSSVYAYGSPHSVVPFQRDSGVVIEIPGNRVPYGYCPYYRQSDQVITYPQRLSCANRDLATKPPLLYRRHVSYSIKRTTQFAP